MNRLRLEGTPRIKRERRQHAPPISPLAADTDFSDFLIPMGENGQDFDFGTAAMKMLEGIRRDNEEGGEPSSQHERADTSDLAPPSPTPGGGIMLGQEMMFDATPTARRRSTEHHRRRSSDIDRREMNGGGDRDEGMEFIKEEED